jgi:hypothetical protein
MFAVFIPLLWPRTLVLFDLAIVGLTKIVKPLSSFSVWALDPSPRTTNVATARWICWIFLNMIFVFIFIMIGYDAMSMTLVLFASVFHLGLLIAGQLAISEDFSVLDGSIQKYERNFLPYTPVRSIPFIILSLTFFLMFLAVFLQKTEATHKGILFAKLPNLGWEPANYFLMLVGAMPILGGAARSYLAIQEADFVWSYGWTLRNFIYYSSWSFAFAVIYMIIMQRRAMDSTLTILKKPKIDNIKDPESVEYAILRIERSPPAIKKKMIKDALGDDNDVYRERLIKLMPRMGAFMFAPTFLHNLHKEKNEKIKLIGLDASLELVNSANAGLDPRYVSQMTAALVYQSKYKHSSHSDEAKTRCIKIKQALDLLSDEAKNETAIAQEVNQPVGPKKLKNGAAVANKSTGTVIDINMTPDMATAKKATGKIGGKLTRPIPYFTVTGTLVPKMAGVPRITAVKFKNGPGKFEDLAFFRASVGKQDDFHVHVYAKDKSVLLPMGSYEFEYRIEV